MLAAIGKKPSQYWNGEWRNDPQGPIGLQGTQYIPIGRIVGKEVLEVGCGASQVISALSRKGYTGLDISKVSLELLRKGSRGNLKLAVGNASALPFRDKSFDTVIAMETMTLLGRDFHNALSEMIRVSRDCVIFSVSHLEIAQEVTGEKGEKLEQGGVILPGPAYYNIVFNEDELYSLLAGKGILPINLHVFSGSSGWNDFCTPEGKLELKTASDKIRINVVAEKRP